MNKINEFINWIKANQLFFFVTVGLVLLILYVFRIRLWKSAYRASHRYRMRRRRRRYNKRYR